MLIATIINALKRVGKSLVTGIFGKLVYLGAMAVAMTFLATQSRELSKDVIAKMSVHLTTVKESFALPAAP